MYLRKSTTPSKLQMLLRLTSVPNLSFDFLDSRLNSFRVNRDKRLDFPIRESPIKTTTEMGGRREGMGEGRMEETCSMSRGLQVLNVTMYTCTV